MIVCQSEEITEPFQLGIHLGMKFDVCRRIEKDYSGIERQMIEVIDYWLKNFSDCSWEKLAIAVKRMRGHDRLAKELEGLQLNSSEPVNEPGTMDSETIMYTMI